MSHATNAEPSPSKSDVAGIPENLPEELLPLYDWWKANGNQFLIMAVLVVVLGGGAWAFKSYRASKIASANQELLKAAALEDLEAVVAKYGSTKVGNAARIRLAKAYYDASKYEEALAAYDDCIRKGAPRGFEDIAKLGRGQSLEGLNRQDEALAVYQTFASGKTDHYLYPSAVMGVARVYAMQGKKDEAKKLLENLKALKTGEPALEMAIANLDGVIDRYEPRAARSLFDMADQVSKDANATEVKSEPRSEASADAVPATPK